MVLWIGIIGFPFVAVFAWVYELTPDGLRREDAVGPRAGRLRRQCDAPRGGSIASSSRCRTNSAGGSRRRWWATISSPAPSVELYNWVAANPAPAATGGAFSCETLGIELTGRVAEP